MAQVPYNPVPQISPTEVATPGERLNTPLAAFGGESAAATEGLGKTISAVGNELWTRAVALQELRNETDAKNANVDFIGKAGDLHAQYNALQGQDRVNAFPKYQQDLKDLYAKTRGSLGNPSAQRMFDGAAISTLNRSIFNAAGSAATAQSQAALGAADAEFNITVKGVYNDPNDDAAYQDAIAKSDQAAVTKAALSPGGASPERVAYLKQQGRSTITYNRIIGMAANEPNKAYQLLKDAEAKGMIFGAQDTEATNRVRSFIHTTGMDTLTRSIIGQNVQPDGTFAKSTAEMQSEAVAQAKKMYPEDPGIEAAAEAKFKQNYYMHNFIAQQDKQQRATQLNDQLMQGVSNSSMLPPELRSQMTSKEIAKFDTDAFNRQKALRTRTDDAVYQKLWGLYHNDNAAFMDLNIPAQTGLSQTSMDKLLKLQRGEAAQGDPRVSRAMTWLRGANPQVLTDLGVIGKGRDEETANQFVGALHEAIQSYQETNGKPPDEKTIVGEIFPTITRQVTQKGWLWNSQTPFFSAPVPSEYAEKYRSINPNATEPEIRRDYNRQMFDQFFKAIKATKDQSRVGK